MPKPLTTAKYRNMAWDAKEHKNWATAAKYYDLALKHYPTHHAGSQVAVEDIAGLRRLRDEMRRNAKPPKPPAGSGLQMQSSFGGGGGQAHFTGGSPKRKGKTVAKKTSKKKAKKGSGSLAPFGVMPDGQSVLPIVDEKKLKELLG